MHPSQIQITDFNYELPTNNIAENALTLRDSSKLLQFKNGSITHYTFTDLPALLPENSLLLFNDSKVIPARIHFTTEANAVVEIFCLEPMHTNDYTIAMAQTKTCEWKCLVGNKKKWKQESLCIKLSEHETVCAKIIEAIDDAYIIQFTWNAPISFAEVLLAIGNIPLPPYIKRAANENDSVRYQTMYAKHNGSVAAPTAGLHFTENIFAALKNKNINTGYITLHVGAGTFKPVKAQHLRDHAMHAEWFVVRLETLQQLANATNLFCVGTTTLRTLESIYWLGVKLLLGNYALTDFSISQWEVYETPLKETTFSFEQSIQAFIHYLSENKLTEIVCSTQIIITPFYKIKSVQALITNFHQPQSTLLLLISSVVGEAWKDMYAEALANDYRFLSYGDSSILWL
jgi:S-adenosylmethionine:tRNA ribosyltransferase-isomerase